jgi:hypothetical protein
VIDWMLEQAIDWVLASVRDTLNLIWTLLAATVFHLPDVTALPQVQTLTGRALLVVNATYGLAIIATGLVIMTHGSVQIRYEAGELLPRLVIGLVAANFATAICVVIIDTTNTMVMALTGQGIASTHTLDRLLSLSVQPLTDPVAALLAAVIGLILVVLVVLLLAGWIARFIALIVLCGIAPLALAGHATPWSEDLARLWWQVMGALALAVILQAVVLNTTVSILLSPDTDLGALGFVVDPSGLLTLLIVAVLLAVTVRIPALVRRHFTQTGGRQNMVGTLVRLVVAQQATRGLAHAVRAGVGHVGAVRAAAKAPRGAHRGGGRHVRGASRANPPPEVSAFSARRPLRRPQPESRRRPAPLPPRRTPPPTRRNP